MVREPVRRYWTLEEYLEYEEEEGIRHEYIDGEIYAMSGGTDKHSAIIANALIEIGQQLRGTDCQIRTSDMRVKINESVYVYPDFSMVCGKLEFADAKHTMLTNPILVAEVISASSANYDKGAKADYYRSLPSLQAYMIIEQSKVAVQLYTRQNNSWSLQEFKKLDISIPLEMIGCHLPLSEIYRNINFEEDAV